MMKKCTCINKYNPRCGLFEVLTNRVSCKNVYYYTDDLLHINDILSKFLIPDLINICQEYHEHFIKKLFIYIREKLLREKDIQNIHINLYIRVSPDRIIYKYKKFDDVKKGKIHSVINSVEEIIYDILNESKYHVDVSHVLPHHNYDTIAVLVEKKETPFIISGSVESRFWSHRFVISL